MTYKQCVAKCVREACLQRQIVEVKFKPTKGTDRHTGKFQLKTDSGTVQEGGEAGEK